jgi:DNA-directed RNA polymerase specialized sigma24 family protein
VVVRYLSEEALRKYSFSTVAWYHLRSELSNYARDQVGKLQEIPIEFYCEIPAPEIAPIDDGLWRAIEDNLTYKQFEAIQFRNQGYTNREIAELCGVGRKAIEKRFARIRKILSDYKEN